MGLHWRLFFLFLLFNLKFGFLSSEEGMEKSAIKVSLFDKEMRIVSSSWVGAGFFAELRQVVYNLIYRCNNHKTTKTLVVDWSQEFFPYKDDPTANGWDLYFEPIHSENVYA